MSSSAETVQQAMLIMKMLSKFGIREGQQRLFDAMKHTYSFFAGGSVTAAAQAFVDGAADVDLKDGSDLDLWVPVFHPRAAPEACYKMLAMGQIDSALVALKFQQIPTTTSNKYYSVVSNPMYKIASVKDYKHSITGRKVQVIAVYKNEQDWLLSMKDVLREFDISICRFYMRLNDDASGLELGATDEALFDDLKRRVFTVNPVLRNTKRTAERVAKYYERGYHMEAHESCCSCKHVEIRALTLDDAIGFVLAGSDVKETASEPKNTVATAPQTPPRKAASEPVCPSAPEKPERRRQKPQLVVITSVGGGSAIPTPSEIAPSHSEKPYERYYKDLKPLLGELFIHANVETNGRLQTFRLYESILRRAMAALGSKSAGKHLLFWRGTARFADYVSDEVVEMIKEMS